MKSLTLPNGRRISCVSKRDARLIYADIFASDCYRKGGVKVGRGDVVVDVGANDPVYACFTHVCKMAGPMASLTNISAGRTKTKSSCSLVGYAGE